LNLLLQRVTQAAVFINKQETARIGQGLLIMVGFTDQDTIDTSFRATKKIISYALFSDSKGRIKKNIKEVSGEILLVPEITLSVKTNTGNKPNFSEVGKFERSKSNFDSLKKNLISLHKKSFFGEFGADMQISSINDGPVTFLLVIN